MENDRHIIEYHKHFKHLEKLRRIYFEEKCQDKRVVLMPQLGDIVLYTSYTRHKQLRSSGIAKVTYMSVLNGMHVHYRVLNLKENKEYEIMANDASYNDEIVTLEKAEDINTFYCGYDSLSGQIIPETISKYKSDAEAAMDKHFVYTDWKSVEFYSVKKIQINVLN